MTAIFRCTVCGVVKIAFAFPLAQRHGGIDRTCTPCILVVQQRRIDDVQRLIDAQPRLIAEAVTRADIAHRDVELLRATNPSMFRWFLEVLEHDRPMSRRSRMRTWLADRLFRLSLRISPNFPKAAPP